MTKLYFTLRNDQPDDLGEIIVFETRKFCIWIKYSQNKVIRIDHKKQSVFLRTLQEFNEALKEKEISSFFSYKEKNLKDLYLIAFLALNIGSVEKNWQSFETLYPHSPRGQILVADGEALSTEFLEEEGFIQCKLEDFTFTESTFKYKHNDSRIEFTNDENFKQNLKLIHPNNQDENHSYILYYKLNSHLIFRLKEVDLFLIFTPKQDENGTKTWKRHSYGTWKITTNTLPLLIKYRKSKQKEMLISVIKELSRYGFFISKEGIFKKVKKDYTEEIVYLLTKNNPKARMLLKKSNMGKFLIYLIDTIEDGVFASIKLETIINEDKGRHKSSQDEIMNFLLHLKNLDFCIINENVRRSVTVLRIGQGLVDIDEFNTWIRLNGTWFVEQYPEFKTIPR